MNSQGGDNLTMDYKSINQFLEKMGELKALERRGWVIRGVNKPETVAGHQYRMAIMAMILFTDKECDVDKVIKLALIHDISEVLVGDITPYDNISQEDKHNQEMEAMKTLSKLLPSETSARLLAMFEEYEQRETIESKLTKQLDVFDAVLQAFEYEKKDAALKDGLHVDMNHFFVPEYLDKIEHPKLKQLLQQLLSDRNAFMSSVNNNVVEFDHTKISHNL